jgi:hypothetical protein
MGLKLYNALPDFLKMESSNFYSFRSSLKNFLLESSIYSIDEFYETCKLRKHKLQDKVTFATTMYLLIYY